MCLPDDRADAPGSRVAAISIAAVVFPPVRERTALFVISFLGALMEQRLSSLRPFFKVRTDGRNVHHNDPASGTAAAKEPITSI